MTLLFYRSHCWKKVKRELRQGNVILFVTSTELHHIPIIFKEKTIETLEIT